MNIVPGCLVEVIHSRMDYASNNMAFPPIGTQGEVTVGLDSYGEYEVYFPEYLCPTLDGPDWIVHKSMIVRIDSHQETKSKERKLTVPA